MADGSSGVPMRRATDLGRRSRLRAWWQTNGVQVIVFALLAVIVAGELSDFVNDRAQERRDELQACVVANLSETAGESLRRLRIQAPVIEAAGKLITAATPEERAEAEEALRVAVREREDDLEGQDPDDLARPEDCEGG